MRDDTVEAVRRFSRFYTRTIEVLGAGILDSPFSLGEVRCLYEIAHGEAPTAADLSRALALDPGQVSRLLRGLERRRLVGRHAVAGAGRRRQLELTEDGRAELARLEAQSQERLRHLLAHLALPDERRLREALARVERLMTPPPRRAGHVVLRPPRPGEYGWVVARHGALYAEEHRWDETFEALVAEIVAEFVRTHDPRRERALIGELDGEAAGSIFLVRQDAATAKLRLLLVEPWARGSGLGRQLVEAVIADARALGYRRIVLWTQESLHGARRLYTSLGFRLTAQEPHRSFGHELVGETWELAL